MFDIYEHHEHSHTVHKTIEEKRAPTDESVKLLREMEKKARDEVIKSVSVAGNDFKCVVHFMYDALSDADRFRTIYEVNGKKRSVNTECFRYLNESTSEKMVSQIITDVANDLSIQILMDPLTKVLNERDKSGCLKV